MPTLNGEEIGVGDLVTVSEKTKTPTSPASSCELTPGDAVFQIVALMTERSRDESNVYFNQSVLLAVLLPLFQNGAKWNNPVNVDKPIVGLTAHEYGEQCKWLESGHWVRFHARHDPSVVEQVMMEGE